jgi:hypothetical protein
MKSSMTRLLIIACLWLGVTASANADDYYFSAAQNSGTVWIGGTSGGVGGQGFLDYPAVYSRVAGYGPNVPWEALVDTNVPKGDYYLGTIPWIGEEVAIWFTVY